MNSDSAIRIQSLTHTHPGESAPLLESLELTLATGELLTITGPSGAGKTTLLNLIAGLLVPNRGSIRVMDREMTSLSASDRARWRGRVIGYAYQDTRLLPQLDVQTNVAWPLLFGDHSRREALRQAQRLLARLGLEALASHRPTTLSGGEQRRVALARALAGHPPLLLVDEPTANLDDEAAASVLDLLRQVRRELHTTVLVVSHHREVLELCPTPLTLRGGRLSPLREGAMA
ncbi:ABC transporter ATP-binding protein [Candidatus Sumerlaeota bacterium]|nr:ABC transporter ATP-binding protein [Candidatus Sumerlaeota bacterium]